MLLPSHARLFHHPNNIRRSEIITSVITFQIRSNSTYFVMHLLKGTPRFYFSHVIGDHQKNNV